MDGRRDGGGVGCGACWAGGLGLGGYVRMDGGGRVGAGRETEGGEGGKRLCSVFAVEAAFLEHVESCQCRV